MRNAPDSHELKILIADLLKHGDRVKLANVYGITEQAVGQRFDPNGDGKCRLYEGLFDLWAITGVNEDAGRALRVYIGGLFESWLSSDVPRVAPDELLGTAADEFADVIKARLAKKPAHVQRKEVTT
jgi:hypothetical protein